MGRYLSKGMEAGQYQSFPPKTYSVPAAKGHLNCVGGKENTVLLTPESFHAAALDILLLESFLF